MRIEEERRIVREMILLHCSRKHGIPGRSGTAPCAGCRDLMDYADHRLAACRYGAAKTSCRRCPTHCYAPARREAIRIVMRYSGPRMLLLRPLAAIRHLLE
ncbi:MAG: hypothetical protein A2Z99_00220 [Treponema sp. GWB1_62_6]|nr:MAG: hypothetical protein A2001_20660 [Treponema sp. GWC1_61_84]OHE63184.1 MAG: hypothetical protein A2Z99_00220 [Treponema sp. GWB1_62_6]